ncbi:MAG: homocysteine S-methyltransferase family protein [Pseudomonadota bacterium]
MNRYEKLLARMRAGERILIDGATGTECEVRGVPQLENAWNGGAAISHPDIVRQIHEDYLALGAEIIISNTFGTSKNQLTDAGVVDQFEEYNRRAVEIALEARAAAGNDNVLVAGGQSCWTWTDNCPAPDELRVNAADQAAVMRDAGADVLMLEMMISIDNMLAMLEGAQSSGLPVWVGMSCDPNEDGTMGLFDGDTLADAIEALKPYDVPLISIMHTRSDYVAACLDVVDAHWDGLVGLYPDSGIHEDTHLVQHSVMTPHDFAAFTESIWARNFNLIGSCCGLGVNHLKALQGVFKQG